MLSQPRLSNGKFHPTLFVLFFIDHVSPIPRVLLQANFLEIYDKSLKINQTIKLIKAL